MITFYNRDLFLCWLQDLVFMRTENTPAAFPNAFFRHRHMHVGQFLQLHPVMPVGTTHFSRFYFPTVSNFISFTTWLNLCVKNVTFLSAFSAFPDVPHIVSMAFTSPERDL